MKLWFKRKEIKIKSGVVVCRARGQGWDVRKHLLVLKPALQRRQCSSKTFFSFLFSLINRNIWPLKKITGPDVWNLCSTSQTPNSSFTVLLCTSTSIHSVNNICTKQNICQYLHKTQFTQTSSNTATWKLMLKNKQNISEFLWSCLTLMKE